MDFQPPTVRIGVVSWNVAEHLDRCLAALPEALDGLVAEVVVVDNDSADDSAATAARHPGVDVVRNDTNVGYARAMNQALAGTDAEVLIALNPDTLPPPGSLRQLVERIHGLPDVGLLAPRLVNADGSAQHSVHRFPSLRLFAVRAFVPQRLLTARRREHWLFEGAIQPGDSRDVDWAVGAVHVIRLSAVPGDRVYSERWFIYVEDMDLCWRLRQDGWRVHLADDVVIEHVGQVSGTKKFGGGVGLRWWNESYDWFGITHGPWRTRIAAALVAGSMLVRVMAARVRGGRAWARQPSEWRAMLRLHARTALHGPPAPLPPPE